MFFLHFSVALLDELLRDTMWLYAAAKSASRAIASLMTSLAAGSGTGVKGVVRSSRMRCTYRCWAERRW